MLTYIEIQIRILFLVLIVNKTATDSSQGAPLGNIGYNVKKIG